HIEGDWFPRSLPENIHLDEMAYPDTAYSFTSFFSKKAIGFKMGYASGNYGHGIFTSGKNGEILIGDFVVLQCTRIFCNLRVEIKDHCMFSWGSTITDSWISHEGFPIEDRARLLEMASRQTNRHIEFDKPRAVFIDENVWVGFEAVILPGVNVGRGAIIGSKSVVVEDVPPYAIVVGNPGRIVRFLEPTDRKIRKEDLIKKFTHVDSGIN
ncbi:MAG: acyltransferase, partial [Saprospiraceae bacterium]